MNSDCLREDLDRACAELENADYDVDRILRALTDAVAHREGIKRRIAALKMQIFKLEKDLPNAY